MHSVAFLGRLALILLIPICAAGAGILRLVMLTRVNERLPAGQGISYYRGKVEKLHREFYPASRLVLAFRVCALGTWIFLILAGIFF